MYDKNANLRRDMYAVPIAATLGESDRMIKLRAELEEQHAF